MNREIVAPIISGAVVGATIGLLAAPKSGKDTRLLVEQGRQPGYLAETGAQPGKG